MITSRQNPKIKQIKKLNAASKFRSQSGKFIAEGIRLLEEADQTQFKPEWVIYTESLDERGEQLLDRYRSQGIPCDPVTPEVMEAASDTRTPQGVLGVFPLASLPLPPAPSLLVILDALRDPGNLGTLMRTSLAAGADGLLLGPGCVDPFSPKVVRSGLGAHFKLPILSADWPEIETLTGGMLLLLAEMENGRSLWETDLTDRVGLILGSEAHGPGEEARKLAQHSIRIPMNPAIESLNAAAAGAVLLFEVKRQRS
jgi:TrmH family RNA methyltransferase